MARCTSCGKNIDSADVIWCCIPHEKHFCPKCGKSVEDGNDFDILAGGESCVYTLRCQNCDAIFSAYSPELHEKISEMLARFLEELAKKYKVLFSDGEVAIEIGGSNENGDQTESV